MLRTLFLLDPSGNDLQLHAGPAWLRSWAGVQVVVPRSLCTYLRLDATGVPLRRLRGYVELQVAGQSPFRQTGFFAARVGTRFHVWLWDQQLVQDLAVRQDLTADRLHVIPSSVLGPRLKDSGAFFWALPGTHGVEAQLWHNKKFAFSAWFPQKPSPEEWAGWRHEVEAREGVVWPASPPMQRVDAASSTPWARNFVPVGRRSWSMDQLAPVALGVLTTALLAYGAWVYGQIVATERVIQGNAPSLDGEQAAAQQQKVKALDVQRWVQDVGGLRGGQQTSDLLRTLAPVLAAEGLLLREIDVQGGNVTATLRPTREFKMASFIERLENSGSFQNARLLEGNNGALRFSWRIRDTALEAADDGRRSNVANGEAR